MATMLGLIAALGMAGVPALLARVPELDGDYVSVESGFASPNSPSIIGTTVVITVTTSSDAKNGDCSSVSTLNAALGSDGIVTDSLGLADPTPDKVVVTVEEQYVYLPLVVRQDDSTAVPEIAPPRRRAPGRSAGFE